MTATHVQPGDLSLQDDVVLIFNSIHRVLRAEKVFKTAPFPFKMQPTPRPLVSDCGLSILLQAEHLGEALRTLADHRIQLVQAWRLGAEDCAAIALS